MFDEWRYLDHGEPGIDNSKRPINPDFVLNDSRYAGAQILLTRRNFGCGSSREHAPWALEDYGFRAIIAPSFADIFYNNCFKNGLLPITLSSEIVDNLFSYSGHISIDLNKNFRRIFVYNLTFKMSNHNQGNLAKCSFSNERILLSCCNVKPISSKPFMSLLFLSGSTSKL